MNNAPLQLQSALREFDFLNTEDRRASPELVTRHNAPAPLILGGHAQPEQLVPPSPQPVIEFPEDEVLQTASSTKTYIYIPAYSYIHARLTVLLCFFSFSSCMIWILFYLID